MSLCTPLPSPLENIHNNFVIFFCKMNSMGTVSDLNTNITNILCYNKTHFNIYKDTWTSLDGKHRLIMIW